VGNTYTFICGIPFLYGVHDFLTNPVNSGNWQGSLFVIPFALICMSFSGSSSGTDSATFAFGPDRILVRSWIDLLRGRPPRAIKLTPDVKIVFQLIWGLTIRTSSEQLVTNAQYFPLVATAAAHRCGGRTGHPDRVPVEA